MTAIEALCGMLQTLAKLEIPHMVTGSFATNLYSIPCSSKDADLIVEADAERVAGVLDALPPGLKPVPAELLALTPSCRRWVISVDGSAFQISIYPLDRHAFDRSRFDRRERLPLVEGVTAWVPTAEDVLVQKLRWISLSDRDKDREDAIRVIQSEAHALDWPYVEKWCAELGASEALAEARRRAEG